MRASETGARNVIQELIGRKAYADVWNSWSVIKCILISMSAKSLACNYIETCKNRHSLSAPTSEKKV